MVREKGSRALKEHASHPPKGTSKKKTVNQGGHKNNNREKEKGKTEPGSKP